jgi:hypothetical protein
VLRAVFGISCACDLNSSMANKKPIVFKHAWLTKSLSFWSNIYAIMHAFLLTYFFYSSIKHTGYKLILWNLSSAFLGLFGRESWDGCMVWYGPLNSKSYVSICVTELELRIEKIRQNICWMALLKLSCKKSLQQILYDGFYCKIGYIHYLHYFLQQANDWSVFTGSGVANSIIWGGGQYSYIRVLHH